MDTSALRVVGTALIRAFQETEPTFYIGGKDNPYLKRWIIRHPDETGGIYLHQILRDDDDRALHDHPWDSDVYIIQGSYLEITPEHPKGKLWNAGSCRRMVAETAHRLVVVNGPLWTLVFTGPRRREWGFHCPQGWRHWRDFVDARDTGSVGRGCE